MPSMEDMLLSSYGSSREDIVESRFNSIFLNNKNAWIKEAVTGYIKYNVDPNDTIAKIAASNNLNSDQIQRIVEEVNVSIYLDKYAKTKGSKVRKVSFTLADTAKITSEAQSLTKAAFELGDYLMEKVASCDSPKTPAFLTDSNDYFSALWENELPEKVASYLINNRDLATSKHDAELHARDVRDIKNKIASISLAIIHNEQAEQGGQELFDHITKEAGLDEKLQLPIILYTNERIASLTADGYLPSNFDFKLANTAYSDAFSLGKHSQLSKVADVIYVKSAKLPENVSYADLVDDAHAIRERVEADEERSKALKEAVTVVE